VQWVDEILGTNWKHRTLKPLGFLTPTIIGWVWDKLCQTNYLEPSLLVGIGIGAAMVYKNIQNYNNIERERKSRRKSHKTT
jgi:F0F1-type ATP synthase assembly protein I